MQRVLFLVLALLLVVAAGCGDGDDRELVRVMAAASLTDAFGAIELAFEAANPELDLQLNLAGSASLREQILQGAPADVFASANEQTMRAVVADGAAATPTVFASNELRVAVPVDNPGQVTSVRDLANADLFIGLCAETVPCGDFARQALAQVNVEPSIDTNEVSVRALLTKIEVGELDAGVVYATDVAASDDVIGLALPRDVAVSITYPIAPLTNAANPGGADTFVAFVLSDKGQEILSAHGFGAP